MKTLYRKLSQFTVGILLFGLATFSSHAFTSLYVFGDALSATNGNSYASSYPKQFYGNRYSNGRIWVEVLAQRQGIGISNNWSYFDCNSASLLTNAQNFSITQQAANNALFVVWCNNSDLYDIIVKWGDTNVVNWTTNIMRAQTNEFRAITNLYSKGVRTIVMPNAVDLSEVPGFAMSYQPSYLNFVRQQCNAYNKNFASTLNLARAVCPGLTIYEPNFFGLLDNVLTNAAAYGLTNTLYNNEPIDAFDAASANYGWILPNCTTNGLGTNFVYWGNLAPSARFHAIIADVAQQIVSPVQVSRITALNGSNQLAVANMPVGLNGFVESTTNLTAWNWAAVTNFVSTSVTQSVYVSTASSSQNLPQFSSNDGINPGGTNVQNTVFTDLHFYRLKFPYAWTWP